MMVARLTAGRRKALQPLAQAAYSIIAARLSVAENGRAMVILGTR
jgi:hypothetical protein